MTQPAWGPAARSGWATPPPPPQRRGYGVRTVLLVAALVIAGGVLVMAGVSVWSRLLAAPAPDATASVAPSNPPAPSSAVPSTTASMSAVPTRSSVTPSVTTSPSTPTPSPVPSVLPLPSGVGGPDAHPGDVPQPTTLAQAGRWLTANAVYRRSVRLPTNCGLPLIDPATIKAAALEKHLTRVAGCLTMVWRPALAAAGFAMPYPPITVYAGSVGSPCGKLDAYNAYYCSGNQRIYVGRVLYRLLPDRDYSYDLILAHEYGHAVQARTGIMNAAFWYRYQARTAAQQNEWARRLELQADCFAGTAMNALALPSGLNASDRKGFREVLAAIADDTLTGVIQQHGSAKARTRWLANGLAASAVSACRTFSASPSKVR